MQLSALPDGKQVCSVEGGQDSAPQGEDAVVAMIGVVAAGLVPVAAATTAAPTLGSNQRPADKRPK